MPCDYSKYPKDWKQISFSIRFKRAKGLCEFCGAAHGKRHPVTGSRVVLTTAHIDQDVTNNKRSNLKALCQRCHLRHDQKQHIRNARANRRRRQGLQPLFPGLL